MLRAIDSVGESLRKRIQSNESVSQEPIVKANIAIEVKKVSRGQKVKFPDNITASEDGSWIAQTKSHIELPSAALAGNKTLSVYLSRRGKHTILHTLEGIYLKWI